MQITSYDTQLRYGLALAVAGLLALAVVVGVGAAASAGTITLDDPTNQTVAVDVNATNIGDDTVTDAELSVALEADDGTVAAEQTVNVTAPTSETITFAEGTVTNGTYAIVANSSDATNVSVEIADTRLTDTESINVTDAGNQTVVVDAGFASTENATATITVDDSAGAMLLDDTIEFTASEYDDDEAVLTREYNATNGIESGDLTVSVEYTPANAYDAAYTQVEDADSSSLLGGTIAGQDTPVAIVGGLIIIGAGYYAREEDWI